MSPAQTRAFLYLLTGAICIGFAPILARLSQTGPVASGFWRMAIAFGFMMAWWQWERLRRRHQPSVPLNPPQSQTETGAYINVVKSPAPVSTPTPTQNATLSFGLKCWLFFGVAFFFAGDLATWHVSLQYTTVTNSLLIVNSTVFLVALGAWWIYGEKPTQRLILGAFVGFMGVSVLMFGGHWLAEPHTAVAATASVGAKFKLGESTWFGDMLSLVTNLFYASYLLQLRYARRWYRASDVMRISNGLCALMLLALALMLHETILPPSAYGWGVVIALAVVCQVLGQTLIARGIEGLPLSFSSMVLLSQPVVGAIASTLILNEPVAISQILGGGLVFFGIFLARPKSTK